MTPDNLLDIVTIPEYNEATGLLQQVVDLKKEAGEAFARFANHVGQASIMRIARGLAAMKLDSDGVPLQGDE